MATIRKKGKKWQVAILKKDGFPPVYKSGFYTKQEAKDWASNEEARRQQANYFPEQASQKHTLATTIDRYVELILPSKPKSAKDTLRHLTWWKEKIGGYALARVSPDLIAQYRKELSEGITPKGTKRSSATVNRYMASLSTVFTYAVKECGWIQTNPMLRVYKLKEARGRDRILSYDSLPAELKALRSVNTDNARELQLSNGSTLRVGTSMRSSTLQLLHISEFGKICAKFPDKAREIITGSLNALALGQYVFIESTAEGREDYFYQMCKEAQAIQDSGKKLSPLDFRFHFLPWHAHKGYRIDSGNVAVSKHYSDYFNALEGVINSQLDESGMSNEP